jgi:hypothetical protein
MTSLPCHCCRHVEYLQEISCCFKQRDAAITLTIYGAVASYKVIKSFFVDSRGCSLGNSSTNILELTTTSCSLSQTVQRNALVDHGGFPLLAAIHW